MDNQARADGHGRQHHAEARQGFHRGMVGKRQRGHGNGNAHRQRRLFRHGAKDVHNRKGACYSHSGGQEQDQRPGRPGIHRDGDGQAEEWPGGHIHPLPQ